MKDDNPVFVMWLVLLLCFTTMVLGYVAAVAAAWPLILWSIFLLMLYILAAITGDAWRHAAMAKAREAETWKTAYDDWVCGRVADECSRAREPEHG